MISDAIRDNLKSLTYPEVSELANDVRDQIIDAVSKNGGHLASNLGVVELTLALHRVFDLPNDKIIFDVSHQSYVHKILSGRGNGFNKLRNYGGISGFQLRSESEYDFFGGGHSGTSVSAALGFAEACRLNGSKNYAVAVVGDGSFTNGMIYEALNNAAKEGLRLIIVLNDNDMSISQNVGAVSKHFGKLRSSVNYHKLKRRVKTGLFKIKLVGKPIARLTAKIKNFFKRLLVKTTIFENLGLAYMGPVDGHNQKKLEAILAEAKLKNRPVLLHVCTTKGKGYTFAEEKPELYHSVSGFDKNVGVSEQINTESFSNSFGKYLTALAEKDTSITAITAAMCDGTGLTPFRDKYPSRFYDVGIAEEHAVTFGAGLAASGKKPVVAIYSSFLQRGYDQIFHDVSIQSLPVVFAIDRCGFVSGDGVTHQGIFDLSFLLTMPNISVFNALTYNDIDKCLKTALETEQPVAIRYNKGKQPDYKDIAFVEQDGMRYVNFGSEGPKISIVTYGRTTKNACAAAKRLTSFTTRVVSIQKIKPLDLTKLWDLISGSNLIIFVEEQIRHGGASEYIISSLIDAGYTLPEIKVRAVDERMPTHADVEQLHRMYGMDENSIVDLIEKHFLAK